MRVALIFDRTRPDTTGGHFERAGRALGLACEHWWLRDASRIPAGYDLYLRIDHGDDYLVRLPAALRPAAFYAVDTHLPHSWAKIRRAAGWYDRVFCAQAKAAGALANGTWLPLACDPELHGPASGATRVWDVAFVGTDGGSPRKFYLQALRERYRNSRIGLADYRELGAIYSRARIGFNYSIADDVNMRVFEVLAAGTLLVTNRLATDDLVRLGLEDRRHLVCYGSPQELLDLIDCYLARDDAREAIAQAGCALARAKHTYAHRLEQLVGRVAPQAGGRAGAPSGVLR